MKFTHAFFFSLNMTNKRILVLLKDFRKNTV